MMDANLLPLAPTLAPLVEGDPREAIEFIARNGFQGVQLSAALPGMRPRELDRSARRDLLARLRRSELAPSGVDLWIPDEHFVDPIHADRAVAAILEAVEFAADLGRVPLSIRLPEKTEDDQVRQIRERAEVCNVAIADHGARSAILGRGLDPAEIILGGGDPALEAARTPTVNAARFSDADRAGAGRVPPGTGRLDVLEYQVALVSSHFASSVVLDLRSLSQPRRIMAACRDEWESTGILTRPGR